MANRKVPIDDRGNELFATLASEIDVADEAWQRAAERAFELLHAASILVLPCLLVLPGNTGSCGSAKPASMAI